MIQDITLTDGLVRTSTGCACCSPARDAADKTAGPATDSAATATQVTSQETGTRTLSATYGVIGMTCGHCVGTVREELSALPGVTAVEVVLVAGGTSTVTITATAALQQATVAAAVDDAGYALAAPPR
ncbi:heavy-metal-associated domain-containing protein [Kineococcus auxinigenes]|uniref:heavy-metal-associated domain-containing protein n=1 Tax=unclassified Kineococcus TaxID=2621656 RepID=UPI003D7D0D25